MPAMTTTIRFCLLGILLALAGQLAAWSGPLTAGPDSLVMHTRLTGQEMASQGFYFPELDSMLAAQVANDLTPSLLNNDDMMDLFKAVGKGEYSEDVKQARQILDQAIAAGNFISKLTGEDLVRLPVVLRRDVGNVEAYFAFNSMKLYPSYAEISVVAGITIPQRNTGKRVTLMFGANDIKFSQEGGIIAGKLLLLSDFVFEPNATNKRIAVELLKGRKEGTGDAAQYFGTFITFDCDGLKEFGIEANVHLSRSWVLPVDPTLKVIPNKRVKAHFEVYVQRWEDILVEGIGIDRFVLTRFDDMGFFVAEAAIDLSDTRNPSTVVFPEGYEEVLPENNHNLWRGFFVKTIEVTMPSPFKKRCSGYVSNPPPGQPAPTCRLTLGVENLLVDKTGVTGRFYVDSQLPLISGALMDGAWRWSLDEVSVYIVQSDLDGFQFSGKLNVPILKQETSLGYEAEYTHANGYYFVASLQDSLEFPIWNAAQVDLKTGTFISVSVKTENNKIVEFIPVANLVGSLQIGKASDYAGNASGSKVKVPKLVFENLQLMTTAPYIRLGDNQLVGTIGIEGDQVKIMNFPVSISSIGFSKIDDTHCGLSFQINLNLMDSDDGGLSCTGSFQLIGELEMDAEGGHHWAYDRIDFNAATVTIDLPMFYAYGEVHILDDHPVYGNGFSAKLLAEILKKGSNPSVFKIEMMAIFGKVEGYRYFLVDGYVESSAIKVPLIPGVLNMNGFGGGVFHHMRQVGYQEPGSNELTPGVDLSGLIYEPTPLTKFGIKFAVGLVSVENTFTGKLTAIIRFGPNMSLQNVMFWGVGEFVKSFEGNGFAQPNWSGRVSKIAQPETQMQNEDANEAKAMTNSIGVKVGISFDFEDGFSFHTYGEVSINMSDIKLTGSGTLDMLIDPPNNKWHLYVGGYHDGSVEVMDFFTGSSAMPLYPVSVTIKYTEGLEVSASMYFLTGNDLPGPPPPPEAVASFFDLPGLLNNRDALYVCPPKGPASGTGIAFGAAAFFKLKAQKKGLLGSCVGGYKVNATMAAGFDVSIIKYASTTACSKTNYPNQGLKGARATGMVYAIVEIKGGHVSCIPIPSIGAGFMARADVINPAFFEAKLVIKFVKKLKFGFDIGDECGPPCPAPAQ